jgi:O-antigen ligase
MNSIEFVTTMGKSNNILSSERIRFDIYRTALKISSHFPFGVGPDNFQNGAKAVIILDALNNSEIQVNNFNDLLNNDLLNSDNLKSDISKYKSLQSHYPNMGGIRYTARWDHAHNEWLNVLAENGIAGIILLTLLFIFPIKIFWQNLNHKNELVGMYCYCGILLTVSFGIFGQTESVFSSQAVLLFFIFYLFLFIGQIYRLIR